MSEGDGSGGTEIRFMFASRHAGAATYTEAAVITDQENGALDVGNMQIHGNRDLYVLPGT